MLMSTNWKDMNYDSIFIIVGRLTKMIHYKPVQMIDAPGLAEVFIDLIVRRPPRLDRTSRPSHHLKVLVFFVLLPRRQANYDSILIVDRLKKILRNEPVQIPIDAPGLAEVFISLDSIISDRNSVFTSKFWFFWYHFQVRLRSPPMRLLREHWIETSWLHGLDIANPFPPDLWGYVHGFSYWFDLWIGYVWQISFRRTFEVTCTHLAINRRLW